MNVIKAIKNKLTGTNRPSSSHSILVPRMQAGMAVTYDTAMTISAVWRAINLISGSISTMPWTVNQKKVNKKDNTVTRNRLWSHPADSVLSLMANDEMSAQAWRETMIAWALTWGNGYSEIERDASNRPIALWPLEPQRVSVDRNEAGNIVYKVKNNGREDTILQARDVFHLHGLGFDGLTGYSVIGYAAKTMGVNLATEQFGASFFENGASFTGVFEHPTGLSDDAFKHIRESLADTHGGPHKANKPLILEEGMKFNKISIPPNEAQFIESRKFSVIEIARWYGIPPHKLMEMEQSTFNNIEHQSIEYVTDALMPWIVRLETEADIKLVSPQARRAIYTKINVNGLLRGDMATRKDWYKEMLNQGVYSINEVRGYEDENPIGPDGDKRLVQINQTTLEKIGEEPEQPQQQPNTTPVPPQVEENDQEQSNEEVVAKILELESKLMETMSAEDVRSIVRESLEEPTVENNHSRIVLVESMERVITREMHRAKSALKRYSDRKEMVVWMDKFYKEHRTYMAKNLTSPLLAVREGVDLEEYIEHHVSSSRLSILLAFDKHMKEPEFIDPSVAVSNLLESE